MMILRKVDIQTTETPGGNFSSPLATPSLGVDEVSVIHQRELPEGKNPPHTHNREEVMVMLAGTVTVTVADETAVLETGDTLIVPAQTLHNISNTSNEPAEWLIIAPRERRFFTTDGQEISPPWAQ